jgi:molybdopterin/thiamine biosynthesis adenylyltransferase
MSAEIDTPDIITVTSNRLAPGLAVFLVGAGGTGARVAGPLSQILRAGDRLIVIDHDTVEERNLLRQNFAPPDVGRLKAEVIASRYRAGGRIHTAAVARKLEGHASFEAVAQIAAHTSGPTRTALQAAIILGCVDNGAARTAMKGLWSYLATNICPTAWIDVGNENRGGQALISLARWPAMVKVNGVPSQTTSWLLPGLDAAMPQLLISRPEETGCDQVDMQTVMVNHFAAAAALNMTSWLLRGIPFSSAGTFFSTLNSMQPIRILAADRGTLRVDTTFAEKA